MAEGDEFHASCLDCGWLIHHESLAVLEESARMHSLIPSHRAGPEPCSCGD